MQGAASFEQDREGGSFVSDRADTVWWTLEPSGEANTNDGDPDLRLGMQPEFGLLHPRSLLATAILEVLGEDRVAGRAAVVLRATPRCRCRELAVVGFWGSAEPMEVPIDLENGLALGGFRFRVQEAALDEEFPSDLFTQPYPDDRPVHRGMETPRELSLERPARRSGASEYEQPSRTEVNAIRVPSGDHPGYSMQASVGIRRRCDPSGFIRNPPIGSPSRSELNTILLPSGDQSGPQLFPGSLVRFRAPCHRRS